MWADEFDSGDLEDDGESHEWDLGNLTDSALASIGSASCPPKWRKIEEYQEAYDYFVDVMCDLVDEFRHNEELSGLEKVKLEDAVNAGFEALHLCKKVEAEYPSEELAAEQEELTEKMRDVLSIKKRFAETEQERREYHLLESALKTGFDVDLTKYIGQLMDTYSEVVRSLNAGYGNILQHYHDFDNSPEHRITVSHLDDFKSTIQLAQKAMRIAGELDGLQAGDEWTTEKPALILIMKNIRHAYSQILENPDAKIIFDDQFYQSLRLEDE